MRDVILLCVHVIVTIFRVARPGGARSVLAESVLLKHQLLILDRSRRRAPIYMFGIAMWFGGFSTDIIVRRVRAARPG
jgi:hypothetical protein